MRDNIARILILLIALGWGGYEAYVWYGEQKVVEPEFRTPDAPYMPTPQDVVDRMLEAAALQPDEVLYDLGSGDGRILLTAAARYEASAWGFELDPELVRQSRDAARESGFEDRIQVRRADILTIDLSEADVVTLSLTADLNRQLIPQLRQLKPGARIVSHDHALGPYLADKLIRFAPDVAGGREHLIYVWTTPLRTAEAVRQVNPGDKPDINFVPTPEPVVTEMLALARLGPGELLFDLGSGDGRILFAAAEAGANAVGYEIDPQLVAQSVAEIEQRGLADRVEVRAGNLFDADLSGANVVTLYLSPTMNRKLIPQFDAMPAGARIVSHDFDIPGIKHQTVVRFIPGGSYQRERTIYLWTTPLERIAP